MFTCSSERALVSSVVSQSWSGIHLAQPFVALQGDALAAGGHDRLEQADGAVDRRLVVLAAQRAGLDVDLLQRRGVFVELARLGRRQQRLIDHRDFLDAAQRALEREAGAFDISALPAAFGFFRQHVEPARDIGRGGARPFRHRRKCRH